MTSDSYISQESTRKVVFSKINLITRLVTIGPLTGGLAIGILIYYLGSIFGVTLTILIPASLLVGVLSATLVMAIGSYMEKQTLSSPNWLQHAIDEVTIKLKSDLTSALLEGRLHDTLADAIATTPGVIYLADSSSISIQPVSKELIELKLQLAMLTGTPAQDRLEVSKYGYPRVELERWRDHTHDSRRFHLVCFVDVPQYALDEFDIYTCRSDDLVARTLEIASRKGSNSEDIELARNRFRDLVDKLVAVQSSRTENAIQVPTGTKDRLGSLNESNRFHAESSPSKEQAQNHGNN